MFSIYVIFFLIKFIREIEIITRITSLASHVSLSGDEVTNAYRIGYDDDPQAYLLMVVVTVVIVLLRDALSGRVSRNIVLTHRYILQMVIAYLFISA